MRDSDIFNSFVKIAQEKGLISTDAPEKAKKKLELNPRADSQDISTIEALYGVKPEAPKSMQYEKNISEKAHPNSVIISPSHDKINGLFKNDNQRQNILLNLLNKNPNGNINQHKYAETNLLMSLIKLNNNIDNPKLKALSNSCLNNISNNKQIKKNAIAPLFIAQVAGVLVGALWVQQHLPFISEGFERDFEKLMKEIEDTEQGISWYGSGEEYTQSFKNLIQDLKNKLNSYYSIFKRVQPVITEYQRPKPGKAQEALSSSETKTLINAYNLLKNATDYLVPYLEQFQKNLQSESYKVQQVQDKGMLNKIFDATHVLHGGKGLSSDNLDDIARALTPFINSMKEMVKIFSEATKKGDSAQQDIAASAQPKQESTAPATTENEDGFIF